MKKYVKVYFKSDGNVRESSIGIALFIIFFFWLLPFMSIIHIIEVFFFREESYLEKKEYHKRRGEE